MSSKEPEPYIVSIARWLYRWVQEHDKNIDNSKLTKVSDKKSDIPNETVKNKNRLVNSKSLKTKATKSNNGALAKNSKKISFRFRLLSWQESLIILLVVLVGTSLVWNRVADWYTVETANPAMVKLAKQAHMSTEGEVLFLRTHPQIDSPDQFDSDCSVSRTNQQGSSVLGCYIPGKNKIYILSMPSNLHNVEVSTAAYELLHPIYLHISSTSQKNQLNSAIETNYQSLNGDDNLSGQVSTFAVTEPGDRDNELFSILGTEYNGSITNNLLNFYQPYFTDGLDAVNFAYNQVQQMLNNDYQQLSSLNDSYNSDISDSKQAWNYYNEAYYNASTWIGVDESQFEYNMNIADQDYTNYSRDIDNANSAASQYNQLLSTYNSLVASYTGGQQINQLTNVTTQQQNGN